MKNQKLNTVKSIFLSILFVFIAVSGAYAQANTDLTQAKTYVDLKTDDSYSKAIEIYAKYATELDGEQLNNFGFCYWSLKDYGPALKYFELSAAKGYDWGIFNAGYNYFFGNGTEKSYKMAYAYLSKLKENSGAYASAQHYLGHCIENDASLQGSQGEPNYKLAYNYLLTAAKKGDLESMFHVATYNNNSGKVNVNYQEARFWYTKACDANYKPGCNELIKLNEFLAKQSTPNAQDVSATNQKPFKNDYLSVLEAINNSLIQVNKP